MNTLNIGLQFTKQLSKDKTCKCEIVDIVKRISTATGKTINVEYWVKCDTFNFGKTFEVSKNTILRGKI